MADLLTPPFERQGTLILGCGYLGRRVAALWQAQGRHVAAVSRRPEHLSQGVEPIVCDIVRPDSMSRLPNVETVLYAVGFDRASGTTMREVYVAGLANVLDKLPAPRRFIYVSSASVYGQTDGGWVDESAAAEPGEESGRIVLEAENLLRARMPSAMILRFAGIYGPGRLLRQRAIETGEPIAASADKWLNLIHVDDGARAVVNAEERGQAGRIYNVCDDHPVRRRYFYQALARLLNAPEPRFIAPPPDRPPPHESAHRRLSNRRLKEELGLELRYPDYASGLRASLPIREGEAGEVRAEP